MRKVWLILAFSLLFIVAATVVVFAKDYISDDEYYRNFNNSWSTPVTIEDDNNDVRLSGSYTKTTTGIWPFKKTHYSGIANGTAYYSRVYIAVTLWHNSDWTYTSSTSLNNGSCSATHTLNNQPTKAQFYFRDGEYGYTPSYDIFSILVRQA